MCICRRLAVSLRFSSAVSSGSGWFLKCLSWCPAQSDFDGRCDQTLSNKVEFLLAIRTTTKHSCPCIQLEFRSSFHSSPHVLLQQSCKRVQERRKNHRNNSFLLSTFRTHFIQRISREQPWQNGSRHATQLRKQRTVQTEQRRGCPSRCGSCFTFF